MGQLTFPLLLAETPEPAGPSPHDAFTRAFRRLGLRRAIPDFKVEFRSFAGLRSTIRLRENQAQVRVSDVLADAPPLVHEALAEILLGQLFRRRPSREARECYLAHVFKPAVRLRIDEARRQRGKKHLLPPRGRHFDLEEIFAALNQKFFRGELPTARLGWSRKRSRRILGHYDDAHQTITITRWFDASSVSRDLVEYVVFHEMLHMRFPTGRNGHRRVVHSSEFRKSEKQFPQYETALRQLKKLTAGRATGLD
ncbi:MAG TPA: SprT-like domain-containing protein [Terriglobia bacterium]|nr:SprT-like domain-containing protein [Terriglobia bacterium]